MFFLHQNLNLSQRKNLPQLRNVLLRYHKRKRKSMLSKNLDLLTTTERRSKSLLKLAL